MGYVLGVDCPHDVRALSPSGDGKTVWQDLCDWLGGIPPVMLRYVTSGGRAATPMGKAEAEYILAQGSPLVPIYNGSPIDGGSVGTYQQGALDATNALALADALGQPDNTYMAFDVEANADVTGGYLDGLTATTRPSRLAGSGIAYGLTGTSGNLGQALAAARSNPNVQRLILWPASWFNTGSNPLVPANGISLSAVESTLARLGGFNGANLAPILPGAVRIWQFAAVCFGGLCDLSFVDEALLQPSAQGSLWLPTTTYATVPPTSANTATPTSATPAQLVTKLQSQVADVNHTLAALNTALGG